MHLKHRTTCRVCGLKQMTKVIDLGEQFLQGSFIKEGKESPPNRKIPLSIVRCDPTKDENACGLLQLEHSVPPEILYSDYWYRSGTNMTMRNHLKTIADHALSIIDRSGGIMLDIGCNDGTLLGYYPDAFRKIGIDPSDIAKGVSQDIEIINSIFPSRELNKSLAGKKCDVVTSIAMFYDLEDPIGFAKNVKSILSDDGIWIFEMSYMPTMLEMNSYDTICHEHLEYYSLAVIEYILRHAGLQLFNATLNSINGGSVRCYATHEDNFKFRQPEFATNIRKLRQKEFDLKLDTDEPYKNFQDRINKHKEELNVLLRKLKKEGKAIHVYGASTKGNTILQWCGIDDRIIDVAAERNPDKYGAKTLGTNISIVSEEDSRKMNPDYYLVLPWHFKEEFLEREKDEINKGVKFIFPLPIVEVI